MLLALVFFAVYWGTLLFNYQAMREDMEKQAEIRAIQSADAMSQQILMLAQGLDYILRTLSREYSTQNWEALDRLARGVMMDYPSGAIVQIAVADTQGDIRYSTLLNSKAGKLVSIADREHFQVHLKQQKVQHLFVGKPVQGRVSGLWSIQVSRPIWRGDEFIGVIVLSLSPTYMASLLGQLAGSPLDTVFLVRDDGSYLARSNELEKVLGTALPTERPFLRAGAALRGNYEFTPEVDGVHRFYGWRKLPDLGLNLAVGVAASPVLAPVEETIRHSIIRNGVGTALLLLAYVWIVFLFWRLAEQRRTLRTLFDVLPVGVLLVGRQGDVSSCNAMATKQLSGGDMCSGRLDAANLAGRLISEDGTVLSEGGLGEKSWAGQEHISEEVVGLLPSDGMTGDPRWLSISAAPLRLDWQSGAVVVLTDISNSKRAEIDLLEKEARLRLVLEAARHGIWEWNLATGEIHWDDRCGEMLGYEPGQFQPSYSDWVAMLHEADKAKFTSRLWQCVQFSEPFDQDFRVRDAEGNWRWLETRGKVVEWEQGLPVRMLGIHTDIRRRVAAEQLRRALLDNSPAAILIANVDRRIEYANRQVAALLGYSVESLINQSFRVLHLDEANYLDFGINYDRLQESSQIEVEFPFRHQDGGVRWCTIHGAHLETLGESRRIVWTLFDNTSRHYAQEALAAERQRLEAIVDRFPAGVLVVDEEDRITHSNQAFAELFGPRFSPAHLLGMSRKDEIDRLAPLFEEQPDLSSVSEELTMRDGRILTREEISIAGTKGFVGQLLIYQDITEYKQREKVLEHLATTDALTELSNRRSFMQRCELEVERLRRYGGDSFALVMFDLDHFKQVNDTWGHPVGDLVLVHVAAIVRQLLRVTDVAGRLGGEEFMVLLPSTGLSGARQLAERLRQRIAENPIAGPAGQFSVSASLGVTTFPIDGSDDLPKAMVRADQALYAAKSGGRNRVAVA